MAQFKSNALFDLSDLKANGFTFGGAGLTLMSLWTAYWFSGDYPEALYSADAALFALWFMICIGTTINWEACTSCTNLGRLLPRERESSSKRPTMLQQNFEAHERSARKFVKLSNKEMDQQRLLYRLASWPNLLQAIPMYHYGLASALGYALSMFSETLRDRKLISLQTDLLILVVGFVFPMLSVAVDCLTLDQVTINPLDYWLLFGAPHT